jgi:hypothetical protein
VPDQHGIAKILVVEDPDDIRDVCIQVDLWSREMRPLPKAGERERVYVVSGSPQPRGDGSPAPAA